MTLTAPLAVKSLWKWPIMATHTLTLSPSEFPTSHCHQDRLADLKLTLQKRGVCVCACGAPRAPMSEPSLHYVWIGYISSYLESAYLQECQAPLCVWPLLFCAMAFCHSLSTFTEIRPWANRFSCLLFPSKWLYQVSPAMFSFLLHTCTTELADFHASLFICSLLSI